ncbi:MAG: hypothetical protein AB1635_20570 [Acidobacteriota bacterium]
MATRLGSVLLVAGACLGFACAGSPPAPPPLRLHADLKQIMAGIIDPSADDVWGAVGTIITADGVQEIRPETLDEWQHVETAAWVLVEVSNSLMIGNRPKDTGDWMRFSQGLSDAALLAVRAAEARDPQALFDAGGEVYVACSNCHSKYNIDLTGLSGLTGR